MNSDHLKQAGLKITLPRIKILQTLENSKDRHLSAEDISKALTELGDEVGLATIYRVLTQFEEAGLVKRHKFEDDHAVYEINEGVHHDHLVCVKCGTVQEFMDEVIEGRQKNIAEQYGFLMTDHALNIYGICPKCRK